MSPLIGREGDQGESLDRRKCSTGLISLFDQTPKRLASCAASGVGNVYAANDIYIILTISKVDCVRASP
jgi:hypothetical protein